MNKNIERTVNGADSLIDRGHDAIIGASERAEQGVGAAAGRVAEKAHVAGEYVREKVVGASERAELGVEAAAGRVAEKAHVAGEYVREKVVGASERAELGVEAAAGRVAEKAHVAGEYLREGADCASRAAHQRLSQAADAIDRGYTRARGDLMRAAEVTTDYIAQNSGKAVLLAASAGFVLGILATRRRLPAAL